MHPGTAAFGGHVRKTYSKDQEPVLSVEHELEREFAVVAAGLIYGLLAKLKEERNSALRAWRLGSKVKIQRLERRDIAW
jgi:hypothetical protein